MSPENGVPDFIEIAHVEQIPDGSGAPFKAAGKDVALFNVGGNICAISDTCPHAGGSLGLGKLDGKIMVAVAEQTQRPKGLLNDHS